MIFTPKSLQDYISCPMLYKYRYIDEFFFFTVEEIFDMAVKQTISQLYYILFDEKIPTQSDAKYKWGEAWEMGLEKHEIMWMERTLQRRLMMRGLSIVLGVQQYLEEVCPTPIAIDEIYGIQIGEHRLETKMNYIHLNKGSVDLIDYVPYDVLPDKVILKNHLPLTAKLLIYENVFKIKVKNLIYFAGKNGLAYYTMRSLSNQKELKNTVKLIADCVDNNVFFKTYSDDCRQCPYQQYCWK